MLSFSIANILKDTGAACRSSPAESAHYPVKMEMQFEKASSDGRANGESLRTMVPEPAGEEASRAPVCSTPDPESSSSSDLQSRSMSPVESLFSSDTSYSFEEQDKGLGPVRRKKSRTTFTMEQINVLETVYRTQRYLPANERRDLAKRLRLSDQQIKTWFQNRRMKEKRQVKDSEDIFKHAHVHYPSNPHPGYHLTAPHSVPVSMATGLPVPAHPGSSSYHGPAVTSFPPIPAIQRHPMASFAPMRAHTLPSTAYPPVAAHVNRNMLAYTPSYLAQY